MKAMGQYRSIVAAGDRPLYATKPYFGRREIGLVAVRKVVTQILVKGLGGMPGPNGLFWINVEPRDLVSQ